MLRKEINLKFNVSLKYIFKITNNTMFWRFNLLNPATIELRNALEVRGYGQALRALHTVLNDEKMRYEIFVWP